MTPNYTPPDERAIIYQLEKVDQGGAVADLFEDAMERVSIAFYLSYGEDEESPYYGMLKLPNGRYADLKMEAYILDPKEEQVKVRKRVKLLEAQVKRLHRVLDDMDQLALTRQEEAEKVADRVTELEGYLPALQLLERRPIVINGIKLQYVGDRA